MNKKAIALALVLVIAMSGVFAAPLEINEVPVDNVVATLTATIGDYFYHGFVISGQTDFAGTVTVDNAFNATAPTFTYGYETNHSGPFYINMTVSDFTNDPSSPTGTVKIKAVNVASTGGQFNTSYANSYDTETGYLIFSATANTYTRNTATIQVVPFLASTDAGSADIKGTTITADNTVAQAAPGAYTATVSFAVTGS